MNNEQTNARVDIDAILQDPIQRERLMRHFDEHIRSIPRDDARPAQPGVARKAVGWVLLIPAIIIGAWLVVVIMMGLFVPLMASHNGAGVFWLAAGMAAAGGLIMQARRKE